jgi:hypothetical protein
MLGLVNAIGAAEMSRFLGPKKEAPEAYGIQVPIPQAQREAKAETPQAVVPRPDENEEQLTGPKGGFDSDRPPERAAVEESLGQTLDLFA